MQSNQYQRVIKQYSDQSSDQCSTYRTNNLSNTPLQIPGSPGTTKINLYGYNLYNPNAVDVFVKLWDSTASPTVGVSGPILTIQVPAQGSVVLMGTDIIMFTSSSCWHAAVTGYLDSNNTAPANSLISQWFYKSVIL